MKNADIYINGKRAVYDEKTLVGTILRNFDFTDPANRKQPYTNTIKLPVKQNQHIFAFANEPGYSGTIPYVRVSVEIFVDGYLILKNGIGYLNSVKEGYYIVSIREQPDVIQTMKDTTLASLSVGGGPYGAPKVQTLLNATSGYKLDFLFNEQSRLYSVANPTKFRLYRGNGNLTYYLDTLFDRMSTVHGITFSGSLMTDSYFLNMRMIVEKVCVQDLVGVTQIVSANFNSEKSFFDLFKAVLQVFGAVYTISGTTITIERYDDITLTKVDWSGRLQKVIDKKFRIPSLAQNNYMRFKPSGEADETLNQSTWTCNNTNIEFENTVIKPDVAVYPFLGLAGLITGLTGDNDKAIYLPDSSFNIRVGPFTSVKTTNNSINDLVFIVDGTSQMPTGTIVELEYTIWNGGLGTFNHTTVGGDNRYIPTYYNSQSDYASFAAMIADPVTYEIEIDLNVLDLHNYDPFNLVIIPELAGEFYVNKLQYNFEKQGKASKVSIIKYVEP